jgi:serine/threonine protein kinase
VREVKSIDICDSLSGSCTSGASFVTNTQALRSLVLGEDDEGVDLLNYSFSSREHLATLCIRNGESRYAVKTLSLEKSSDQKNARARIDLAIEVNYLYVLSHPHIIKIRGIFKTEDPFHAKYFFLMDRLYGTLYDKILEWRKASEGEKCSYAQKLRALLKGQKLNNWNREFSKERLFIAHDIASAIRYMHKNKVIHR